MKTFTSAEKGFSKQTQMSLNQTEAKDEDPEIVYFGTLLILDRPI